jgi:hypothetical protein
MSDNIYVAVQSAMFNYNGKTIIVKGGRTMVREGHPLLKQRPELFVPVRVDYDLPAQVAKNAKQVVEDATSNPNEPRRRGRPPLPRDESGNIVHSGG